MSTVDLRVHHVSTGLRLVYTGLVLLFVTIFVGTILNVALGLNLMVIYAIVGLSILAQLMSIVGQFRCLDVPEKVKATGPIYTAVALAVTSIALSIAAAIPAIGAPAWARQVGQILSTAGSICFLVFLGRLAEFLGDPRQIARARFVLFGTILMMALAIAVVALGPAGLPGGGNIPLVALLGLGLIVFGLVIFVSYARLLDGLRQQIDRHLVGRGSSEWRRIARRSRPIGEDVPDDLRDRRHRGHRAKPDVAAREPLRLGRDEDDPGGVTREDGVGLGERPVVRDRAIAPVVEDLRQVPASHGALPHQRIHRRREHDGPGEVPGAEDARQAVVRKPEGELGQRVRVEWGDDQDVGPLPQLDVQDGVSPPVSAWWPLVGVAIERARRERGLGVGRAEFGRFEEVERRLGRDDPDGEPFLPERRRGPGS